MEAEAPPSVLPLIIFVPGVPAPAGSKKAVPIFNKYTKKFVTAGNGRPIVAVMDDSKRSRPWKDRISAIVVEGWSGPPLEEALALTLRFVMPRPKGHFGSKKGDPYLKPTSPTWHTGKPDATKLVRAVEDALTGIVWKDDAQVCVQVVSKIYGDTPGVQIRIAPAPAAEIVEV